MNKEKLKEIINYLIDKNLACDEVEDLIREIGADGDLFQCDTCGQIYTPMDLSAIKSDMCVTCEEHFWIAA